MLAALALLVPMRAEAATVFDAGVVGAHDFTFFPFWQKVLADTRSQPSIMPATQTGAACASERTCAPPAWIDFLDTLRGLPRRAQLDAVNGWANAKPYVDDWVNWGVSDYWETPGEFIVHGGDCEDFAIAKYFSLIRLGFSSDDLRIVVVTDSNARAFHAVLAVRLDGTTWLLDNLRPAVQDIRAAPQYTPVYSLNDQGWWMYSNPTIRIAGAVIAAGPLTAGNRN